MILPESGVLLRIVIGEADLYHGKPVYEQIVLKARELNLAGATVTRGIMGYGGSSRIRTAKILRLSEDMPVVIEIADTEERISSILPFLEEIITGGIVTMEDVRVLHYRHTGRIE